MNISVIILTYNESKHLRRCLESLLPISDDIHIIDSFSTDDTVAIAESYHTRVTPHAFVNHAAQFQWGLDNLDLRYNWIMRLDADEYLEPALVGEILQRIDTLPPEVAGGFFKAKNYI
jgi:glycosyltransferase involved in cell wall biosynthesis